MQASCESIVASNMLGFPLSDFETVGGCSNPVRRQMLGTANLRHSYPPYSPLVGSACEFSIALAASSCDCAQARKKSEWYLNGVGACFGQRGMTMSGLKPFSLSSQVPDGYAFPLMTKEVSRKASIRANLELFQHQISTERDNRSPLCCGVRASTLAFHVPGQ